MLSGSHGDLRIANPEQFPPATVATPTSRGYASAMHATAPEAAIQKLEEGRKEMITRLRGVPARLDQLSVAESYEAMVWVQPHVEKLLAESDRILEAIDART